MANIKIKGKGIAEPETKRAWWVNSFGTVSYGWGAGSDKEITEEEAKKLLEEKKRRKRKIMDLEETKKADFPYPPETDL